MNFYDKLLNQGRLYLGGLLLASNLLIIGWFVAADMFGVSTFIIIPVALGLAVLLATGLALSGAKHLMKPLRFIWQAVLHLSPTEQGTSAPDLDKVRFGKELLGNLVGQIYQLTANAAEQQTFDQHEQASLGNNFVATNLPLPMLVLDNSETVVFANAAASKYLRLSPEDMTGKSFYSLLDLSFPNEQTFDKWLLKAKETSVTDQSAWERVRYGLADQSSLQFDMAAYYNKDNSNGYETMVVLFDHTESYSQDDQAVSFIALAVHELRTPLTLLRGYIETFQDEFTGKLDPELDTFMHRMAASAEQLAAFVNNILDVARVEDDQLVLQLHEENWRDVVAATVDNFTLRAKVRGVSLECQIADNLPLAATDRVSASEIIGNLIDNAIKYSGESNQIIIKAGLNSEGLIETTVQDFGVGVPTSVIPNLFTKFYRNHRNRAQIGGTGLGLYLCKALVTAHGGHIWVNSEEGKGSSFSFTVLPYGQLADELKASNNKDITRSAHGWIKNHSMYRR